MTLLSLIADGQSREKMQLPRAFYPGMSVGRSPGAGRCCLGQNLAERGNHIGAPRGNSIGAIPYIVPYPVYVDSRDYQDSAQPGASIPPDSNPPQPVESPVLEYPSAVEVPPQLPDEPPELQTQLTPESSCPATGPFQNPVDQAQAYIALKDRNVYIAVAYWVKGDTLHYITPLGIHNQVSLPLVNRKLTARLNADRPLQLVLPPD